MPADSSFHSNNPYPKPDDLELRNPSQDFGNRPASGAPQAAPGDVLNASFQGSANAGDFLGLDVEVGGYDDPPMGAPGSLDLASVPASTPVAEQAYEDDGYGHASYEEPVYDESGFADEPEVAFADPELDAAFDAEEPKAARGSFGFVLGAFLIGLVVVAGFVLGPKYAPDLMERLGLQQPQVARNDGTTRDGANGAMPTNAVATTTDTAVDDVVTMPSGSDTGTELLGDATPDAGLDAATDELALDDKAAGDAGTAGTDAWLTPNLSGPIGDVATDDTNTSVVTRPNAGGVDETWDDPWGTAPTGGAGLDGELAHSDLLPIDSAEGFQGIQLPEGLTTTFDWASSDKLDMIWRDATIPLDAIAAPARLLTPRVGPVRVHMTSGELFEGRLYALGEGQVWLDTAPGRIGLDGERVTRFERILPEEASAGTSTLAMARGERVRIRVPGGVMYGRIVSQDGDTVTLITDEGGRIALSGAVVEALGPSRAIVVER